mgnify:CR=1 FL=1
MNDEYDPLQDISIHMKDIIRAIDDGDMTRARALATMVSTHVDTIKD